MVARILRDAGCEVVYAGLRQSPETIAAMTAEEDVDVVGVSMHDGAHLTLAPAVVGALRAAGLDTPVVIGGIVPPSDVDVLMTAAWPLCSGRAPPTRRSWRWCARPPSGTQLIVAVSCRGATRCSATWRRGTTSCQSPTMATSQCSMTGPRGRR